MSGVDAAVSGLTTDDDTSAQVFMTDYLNHFGLEMDPFEASVSPFFEGADRQQLLDQLLHLCQFSGSAVAVLGEPGMGKTCLRQALLSHLATDDEVCVVDVPILNKAEDILGQIVQGFDLDCDLHVSRGQLLAEIRRYGQAGEEGGLALLVIENAQNLDDQILGALLSLLQGDEEKYQRLHILLFAEPQLAERLDRVGIVDVLVYDLYLEPFSPTDMADYLHFCLEAAGYQGEFPFDDEDLAHFFTLSRGVPGAVHGPARERLLELAAPDPTERSLGLPPGHMLAAAVLGTVLLLGLFYRDELLGNSGGDGASSAVVQSTDVEPKKPVVDEFRIQSALPSDKAALPTEDSALRPTLSRSLNRPSSLPRPLNALSASEEEADSGPPTEAAEAMTRDTEAPVVELADTVALASAPAAGGNVTETEQPVVDPLAGLSKDERDIMGRDKNRYTLQVLGARSRQSVEDFIARQANGRRLQVFTTSRKGRDWYVVIVGEYADLKSARKAISKLPTEQRRAGPWPRSLLSVQDDIRSYRGI